MYQGEGPKINRPTLNRTNFKQIMMLRHSLKIATYTTWYMYLYTKLTKVNTRALDILLGMHLWGIATLFDPLFVRFVGEIPALT